MNKEKIKQELEYFLKYDFQEIKGQSDRWIFCSPPDGEMSIYDDCTCNVDDQCEECPCICHSRIDKLVDFIYELKKGE